MKNGLVFVKGFLMGICDVIPGISGGTIAFITGLYDQLIDALCGFNIATLKLLFQGKIKQVWKNINGNFLVSLFAGIIFAVLTFAKIITYLLETYPSYLRAFFFGLILASSILLKNSIKKFNQTYYLFLIVGTIVGYMVTDLPLITLGDGNWTIFFSGVIAIIAMILPGISGSYILVILGQYEKILGLLVDFINGNIKALSSIIIFVAGTIVGLISFSKLLHWIKSKRHDQMVVVLIGFMLGSLNKIWPWKETIETYLDRHGKIKPLIEKNIWPSDIQQLLIGIGFAIVGIAIVWLIIRLADKFKNK